ncbi:FKBP-type peptidyl-prolyl cis-trans isomerase [Sphingomonas sp. LY54]|uniref:FKBP-type peptidyl-prolyl cis-trans isomerase n=1 Tax=Sphingomonas sp. LY54 TaxID=3095343 RepID=UPI002D766B0A|nr:FKBP-type peptidyl-prolyl cis-trans isomerase [Sphingomonas sp. LY54]WRP28602.1 FKBP-type peptidyl-prolyl cis-trans isomerase [Sphingomonas sp. LY54]
MGGQKGMLALVGGAILVSAVAAASQAPVERDAEWHNGQAVYLIGLKATDGWSNTASGLRYRRVKGDGTGAKPSPGDTVTIHYAGRLIDGTEFDSSIARGEPATFPLPRLIKGWQEGVPLMGVGDTYEFAIPYTLAYGAKGKGPIPGGATLVFTIELIGIGGGG